MSARWTTSDDVALKVRRRWNDGTLLRSMAEGMPFPLIEVPLRSPKAAEIGDSLDAVRDWVSRLDAGRRADARYALEWVTIGGRHFGRNQVPARAVVSSYEQAWALLGVTQEVRRFERILDLTSDIAPIRSWLLAHPHLAVELDDEWERLLAAYTWLDANRGSGRYVREISAPGVDTKFAERHRQVLAGMLGVSGTAAGFLTGLGLGAKPELVRLRVCPSLGLPEPLTELAVRANELAELTLRPRVALVVENEVTYLSVDVPDGGVVIWGKGFEVDRVGRLPWLAGVVITYWGDLDTHGFAILDRLRAWLPQTRSLLMDRETLLAHRERWVVDERPARSALTRLSADEAELYGDLVSDVLGVKVRLEQERIDWDWACERFST
jgi:hypothetical protein